MINYAGVDLLLPTPELESWINTNFSQKYTDSFQVFSGDFCGFFPQTFPSGGETRLNTLVWPRDASRWSYGHFLATTTMVEAINLGVDALYVSGGGSGSGWCSGSGVSGSGVSSGQCAYSGSGASGSNLDGALLKMGTPGATVNCKMFMLPPTPIARIPWNRSASCAEALEGLWLITLVDDRFWWNMRSVTFGSILGGDWDDMFSSMLQSIGTATGTIQTSAPYGLMPAQLAEAPWQGQMAQLFDCYLYQTQKRLIKSLTGEYRIVGPELAKQLLVVNASSDFPITAGGGSRMSPLVAWANPLFAEAISLLPVIPWKECQDLRHILPRGISFIKKDGSSLTLDNPFASPAAANRYKVFGAKIPFTNDYFAAFTRDWFEWRRSHFEATIPGIHGWNLTGFEDYVEYHYGSTLSYTRVVKDKANDLTGVLGWCLCESGFTINGLAEVVSDVLCQAGKTVVKYRTIDARYID